MSEEHNDEAEILFPEQTLEIAGDAITVRELTYLQGLRLGPLLAPLLRDLEAALGNDKDTDLFALESALGKHPEAFVAAVAAATGKPPDWIEALSDADGYTLLMAFWTVNAGFFVRRLAAQKLARTRAKEPDKPASAPSSPSS